MSIKEQILQQVSDWIDQVYQGKRPELHLNILGDAHLVSKLYDQESYGHHPNPLDADPIIAGRMTSKQLSEFIFWCDQTIICELCGKADWGEDWNEDITLFHKPDCLLYGRRDVAFFHCNVEYLENKLGRQIGLDRIEIVYQGLIEYFDNEDFVVIKPIPITVEQDEHGSLISAWREAHVFACGDSIEEAIEDLRSMIWEHYEVSENKEHEMSKFMLKCHNKMKEHVRRKEDTLDTDSAFDLEYRISHHLEGE